MTATPIDPKPPLHPLAVDAGTDHFLRGDPIDGERYHSREFMQREWDHMWTRVWHIAGLESQLREAGDYVVHDFMHESVMVVRQRVGSLRAFYNVCGHRGQRLVWGDGHQPSFHCPYHGWVWGTDGELQVVPDPDDFPQGDPCGKVRLVELPVDTWAGFVWYSMDPQAPPLAEFLHPWPELYRNHATADMIRVVWMQIELDTNWKFAPDNFSESYHVRTAHPQVPAFIDQDHYNCRNEWYPSGHSRIMQLNRPSLRDRVPEGEPHRFDDALRAWDIDPDQYPDYEAKVTQGWVDLVEAKKRLGPARGYTHYERLTEEDFLYSPHDQLFPNVSVDIRPDAVSLFRTEPHPTDPNKCTFDLWCLAIPIPGVDTARTIAGTRPMVEAEFDRRAFDGGNGLPEMAGSVIFQDMQLAEGQQHGQRSRGYQEPYLAGQETRVRAWHETLNDYLEGRR